MWLYIEWFYFSDLTQIVKFSKVPIVKVTQYVHNNTKGDGVIILVMKYLLLYHIRGTLAIGIFLDKITNTNNNVHVLF